MKNTLLQDNNPQSLILEKKKEKPHNLYRNKEDIKGWLKAVNILNYKLIPNDEYGFVVDVMENVNIEGLGLEKISVKFNHVAGAFLVSYNFLTSLYGAPSRVEGSFYCDKNQLQNLNFGPNKVGGKYSCYDNLLTSLEGAAKKVLGFDCSQNLLTSLKGGPQEVRESYYAANNLLTNLIGAPLEVPECFNVDCNKLVNLEGGPRSVWQYVCSNNQLENLMFFPKQVNAQFICHGNPGLGGEQNITSWDELYQTHLVHQEKYKIETQIPEINSNTLDDFYNSKTVNRPKIKV